MYLSVVSTILLILPYAIAMLYLHILVALLLLLRMHACSNLCYVLLCYFATEAPKNSSSSLSECILIHAKSCLYTLYARKISTSKWQVGWWRCKNLRSQNLQPWVHQMLKQQYHNRVTKKSSSAYE